MWESQSVEKIMGDTWETQHSKNLTGKFNGLIQAGGDKWETHWVKTSMGDTWDTQWGNKATGDRWETRFIVKTSTERQVGNPVG